jgi:hypothetical protein
MDDRRATLSRKIAECRRALARGVTIGRAIELWTEAGEATAELTELAARPVRPAAVATCPESDDSRQAATDGVDRHAAGGLGP